jgi:hypothetical protein
LRFAGCRGKSGQENPETETASEAKKQFSFTDSRCYLTGIKVLPGCQNVALASSTVALIEKLLVS